MSRFVEVLEGFHPDVDAATVLAMASEQAHTAHGVARRRCRRRYVSSVSRLRCGLRRPARRARTRTTTAIRACSGGDSAGGPSLACGVAARIAREERGWVIPMLVCGSGITHPPTHRRCAAWPAGARLPLSGTKPPAERKMTCSLTFRRPCGARALRSRAESDGAKVAFRFPLFITREAPITAGPRGGASTAGMKDGRRPLEIGSCSA
jgi:hypothetical protein